MGPSLFRELAASSFVVADAIEAASAANDVGGNCSAPSARFRKRRSRESGMRKLSLRAAMFKTSVAIVFDVSASRMKSTVFRPAVMINKASEASSVVVAKEVAERKASVMGKFQTSTASKIW